MLCNRTSLGERQPLLSLVARVFSFIDNQQQSVVASGIGVPSYKELLTAIFQRLLVAVATECFYFVNGVLDGCVARWGIRDVDRATGGKLGNEPPIVWGPRLAMDDDRCPADAYIGNEVRRRNLLPVVVKAFADGYPKLYGFISEFGHASSLIKSS